MSLNFVYEMGSTHSANFVGRSIFRHKAMSIETDSSKTVGISCIKEVLLFIYIYRLSASRSSWRPLCQTRQKIVYSCLLFWRLPGGEEGRKRKNVEELTCRPRRLLCSDITVSVCALLFNVRVIRCVYKFMYMLATSSVAVWCKSSFCTPRTESLAFFSSLICSFFSFYFTITHYF